MKRAKRLDRLAAIYGRNNVYVELQRHQSARGRVPQPVAAEPGIGHCSLPVVATNGVRYANENDRELLDVFTAIRHGTTLDKAGRLLTANSARYLRTRAERC